MSSPWIYARCRSYRHFFGNLTFCTMAQAELSQYWKHGFMKVTRWKIHFLLDAWLLFTINSLVYSTIVHIFGRIWTLLLMSVLLATDLPSGVIFYNLLSGFIRENDTTFLMQEFLFSHRKFLTLESFIILPRDYFQFCPWKQRQFVSTQNHT